MDLSTLNIAVIGAGIGGLAAARACALRGARVTLHEQAGEVTEVGAGLQISPNGFAVLRGLGLGAAVEAAGIRADVVALHDYRRGPVVRLDLTRLESRDYWFLHRADLIALLHDGAVAAGAEIRLNARITDPAALDADLVIGADGLHSVLRAQLNGTLAPFFTRQVAWRAVVPHDGSRAAEARVHMAPQRHLVSYPLRGGGWLNLVAVEERANWSEESWSAEGDPDDLRARFADFGDAAQNMLKRVTKVGKWGLFRHPVAPVWAEGRFALLGDAAHPTLPFMAQGASLALEDAWVLADALAAAPDMAAALAAYPARRAGRAARVVDAASANAWKYHLGFKPLRLAAHTALRLGGAVAPTRMMRQFDWIYGHDVTGGETL
ncbi:monooxygenase [Pelagivirga sediminicola]|uniref:Monooxygenase n=1 Tax=Pelagivirga sediminicola TaxID=2170575 RepID=A0A2T7G475_9RHOB|nr:FAD-dependent monooxygenase [Pelagivirga sediminicola]PVA09222.1 monooxygenase [Pelagivirga sediminicola]